MSYRRKRPASGFLSVGKSACRKLPTNMASPVLLICCPSSKKSGENERKQYLNAAHFVNSKLKEIGRKLNLSAPLTMYRARHSWASIAKSRNVPIAIISEGMGHDSEATTQIYLASLDSSVIDKANRLILSSL